MPWVKASLCDGCGSCIDECPVSAVQRNSQGLAEMDEDECIQCSRCHDACPQGAVRRDSERGIQGIDGRVIFPMVFGLPLALLRAERAV